MFLDCDASFVACALLSTFVIVTEKERDAVRFIIELIPCYDEVTGKLRMTFDTHVLAQIYLAELRVLASRHSYIHDGSLEEAPQARALLNVVFMPLIRHLRIEEYNNLLESIDKAHYLLSRPLDVLDELAIQWRILNVKVATNWRSHPVEDLENYEFGVELPVKYSLEDLLTPLPYPTKPKPFGILVEYASVQPKVNLDGRRMHLTDSNELKELPRSECAKELEFKEKARPNSNVFTIPLLGDSRGPFDSQSQYSQNSGSSGVSWVYEHEEPKTKLQRMVNNEDMDLPIRALSHQSVREAGMKLPRHKRLSRYVKTLFRHA
ncbi:hypothetical protein B0J17DRAFT_739947 [Rhizoctonia solani]|nr:hypothetical protein B0J17DRAFT_739947 [Rhizoctonia solani]